MKILNISNLLFPVAFVHQTIASHDYSDSDYDEFYPEDWSYRLEGDDCPSKGRIRLYHGGLGFHGTLCENVFNQNNNGATAICRSLGYDGGVYTDEYNYLNRPHGYPDGRPIIDRVECDEWATSLWECYYSDVYENSCASDGSQDAGVECYPEAPGCDGEESITEEPLYYVIEFGSPGDEASVASEAAGEFTLGPAPEEAPEVPDLVLDESGEWEIHLVGGECAAQGAVLLINTSEGHQGALCGDVFERNEHGPNVLCQSLGFDEGEVEYGLVDSDFETYVTVILNGVNCQGTESSIFECDHQPIADERMESCDMGPVGILCYPGCDVHGASEISSDSADTVLLEPVVPDSSTSALESVVADSSPSGPESTYSCSSDTVTLTVQKPTPTTLFRDFTIISDCDDAVVTSVLPTPEDAASATEFTATLSMGNCFSNPDDRSFSVQFIESSVELPAIILSAVQTPITCGYKPTYTATYAFQDVSLAVQEQELTDVNALRFVIEEYSTNEYLDIIEIPDDFIRVAGQDMFLSVKLADGLVINEMHTWAVMSCDVQDDDSDASVRLFDVMEGRLENDALGLNLPSTDDNSEFRFSFRLFMFSFTSSSMRVTCDISVCSIDDADSNCEI